jgi:two-component system cell cycle sensor histidine kinase/response regulator CckA
MARADNPVPVRQPLRVLILEDDPQDAELVAATLRGAGYSLSLEVTDSRQQFQQQLKQADYDVILADYNLGSWTAMDALELLKESGKDIPLIVVTGTLGDEAAVESIKQGAADYILKDRLHRLPVAVEGALRDKVQRQEAARLQEQIRHAKKEWEQTVDTVPDPVLVLDEQFRIQRTNRATARVLGLEFSQLIGQPCYQAVHGRAEPIPECLFQCMRLTGKEHRCDIEEPRLGKVFDATASPLYNSGSAVLGCVEVLRDITERKRAEEQIQSLSRFPAENPNPILRLQPDGTLIYANPGARPLLQLWGCEVGQRVPADWARLVADSIASGAGKEVEVACDQRVYSFILGPIQTAGYVNAYGRDITERLRLEEQLRQAQKMEAIGQLAGGVAHDFNNLLMAIIGYSELLLARLREGDRLRKHIQEIKKAGERAAALTRQLLAFSRRQVLVPQVLDLNSVLSNVQKMLRRMIGEDIDLLTVPASDLGQVRADPGQVEQVIMNLAVNARDAMPEGGKLTLETANVALDESYTRNHIDVLPGRYVMLAVSDTGSGMDAETLSHIFEPFFTTKEEGKGTGLGLATVYGIAKQSGGHIEVSSEAGQGTTFRVYLPRIEAAYEPAALGAPAEEMPRGTETVLLVEDDVVVCELLREMLQGSGYTVLQAGGARQALRMGERYAPRPIHLLLADVVMPEMSGPQLADHLARVYPKMKVLYISGYTDATVARHSKLSTKAPYLQKPFAPEVLARKVREVLDAVPAEQR